VHRTADPVRSHGSRLLAGVAEPVKTYRYATATSRNVCVSVRVPGRSSSVGCAVVLGLPDDTISVPSSLASALMLNRTPCVHWSRASSAFAECGPSQDRVALYWALTLGPFPVPVSVFPSAEDSSVSRTA
jgi:hypothetical protein